MGNVQSNSPAPTMAQHVPVGTQEHSRPEHNLRKAHMSPVSGLGGDLYRSGTYAHHMTAQDQLGRGDLQVMASTVQTRLTDIAGDSARQVNNALFNEKSWTQTDLLPTAGMSRFNQFSSTDLRGDPITPGEEGYSRSTDAMAAVRFGGSEEFMQRRVDDSVAPYPSLLPQAHKSHGGGTHVVRGAQGFDYVSY